MSVSFAKTPDFMRKQKFLYFIVQRVKTRAIPCPHQRPTRGDVTVSMTKMVLPPLAENF